MKYAIFVGNSGRMLDVRFFPLSPETCLVVIDYPQETRQQVYVCESIEDGVMLAMLLLEGEGDNEQGTVVDRDMW